MFIEIFLVVLLIFSIILGILNGIWLHKKEQSEIFNILVELVKIILPIFALISLFLPLDYSSFWCIAYISIYYVLDAIYNLLGKINLQDIQGKKFNPNLVEQKTKKIITSFTIIYVLSFHLLMHYLIINWIYNSLLINIFSIIGLIMLGFLSLMGVSLMLYDFYTIIEFPVFNNIINNIARNIKVITYEKLYKKIKYIDKFFIYVFKPEIEPQINLKSIISTLKNEWSETELNNKLSENDQKFITESLIKFQDCYIKQKKSKSNI